jgi:hypothetical protein
MKRKLLLIITCCMVFACSKDEGDPGCEVGGAWYGSWQASGQSESGYYMAVVNQDNTKIGGTVSVSLNSDANTIYNANFTGKLKDLVYGGSVRVSSVDVAVNGTVIPDSLAPGNFAVPSLSMSGNYNAKRLPAYYPSITEIYKHSAEVGEGYRDIMIVNSELWCLKNGYEWIDGHDMVEIDVLNLSGNLSRSLYFPNTNSRLVSDGTYIYAYSDDLLIKYNTGGDTIQEVPFDIEWSFDLACNGQFIVFPVSMHTTLVGDFAGNITDTITNNYHHLSNPVIVNNTICYASNGQIFCMNLDGSPRYALLKGDDDYISGITYSNGYFYVLAEEHNSMLVTSRILKIQPD